MSSEYLSPYDGPGQVLAAKQAATGGGALFAEDDEGGGKPRAMPSLDRQGGNLMNPSAYGMGAGGDLSPMTDATKLFSVRRGDEGRQDFAQPSDAEEHKAPPIHSSLQLT